METIKSPTMNIFVLLDEEERQKQLERTRRETTTPAPRTTTRSEFRQNTSGPRLTIAKDSYPTTQTRPEQVKGENVFYETSSPITTRKSSERKTQGRPRQRQINVTRTSKQRIFDRHSGTGRPPIENKKGGAGEHNWGGIKDVIEEGINEEYKGVPTQFEQPELEQDTTPAPSTTTEEKTDYLSYNQYSEKIAQQQKQLEEKYGPVSVRSVDTSWAKGLVRRKSADEGEKHQQELPESSKRNQSTGGTRKVVNAGELFKIVTPGHEGREGRKRREYQGRSNRHKRDEKVVDTNDKESFPSLTGK